MRAIRWLLFGPERLKVWGLICVLVGLAIGKVFGIRPIKIIMPLFLVVSTVSFVLKLRTVIGSSRDKPPPEDV